MNAHSNFINMPLLFQVRENAFKDNNDNDDDDDNNNNKGEAVKFVRSLLKGRHFGILMTLDLLRSPLVLIIATRRM